MRLPEPQGLVLFLQISVPFRLVVVVFLFSLCDVQSGQTDGLRARANACGKLSGNGVDSVSQTRKRKACFGELRCSRSDAGKREEGKR